MNGSWVRQEQSWMLCSFLKSNSNPLNPLNLHMNIHTFKSNWEIDLSNYHMVWHCSMKSVVCMYWLSSNDHIWFNAHYNLWNNSQEKKVQSCSATFLFSWKHVVHNSLSYVTIALHMKHRKQAITDGVKTSQTSRIKNPYLYVKSLFLSLSDLPWWVRWVSIASEVYYYYLIASAFYVTINKTVGTWVTASC